MRRLTRAILEIESLRDDLPLLTGPDIAALTLVNTALVALRHADTILSVSPRHEKINPAVNHVDEMIRQVNAEIFSE